MKSTDSKWKASQWQFVQLLYIFISNFSCGEILMSIWCAEHLEYNKWMFIIAQAVHFLLNHHSSFDIVSCGFSYIWFQLQLTHEGEHNVLHCRNIFFYNKFRRRPFMLAITYRVSSHCKLCKLWMFSNFFPPKMKWWHSKIYFANIFFFLAFPFVILLIIQKTRNTNKLGNVNNFHEFPLHCESIYNFRTKHWLRR